MLSSTHRLLGATSILLIGSLALSGCNSEDSGGTADLKISTAKAAPPAATTPGHGSALLNGYPVLPTGTAALCTKQGTKTTVIIGDPGSKSAASAILEGDQATNVTITDPEDTASFYAEHGQAHVTKDGEVVTIEGDALGVRKNAVEQGEFPMPFSMSFICP